LGGLQLLVSMVIVWGWGVGGLGGWGVFSCW
jgi:hypothetical protein